MTCIGMLAEKGPPHDEVIVNIIVSYPGATPVTFPSQSADVATVAILVLLLLQ